jgi:hypothetical protein
LPDVLFTFGARNKRLVAAFLAFHAKIHAGAQHKEPIIPARVVLFHDERVAHSHIHKGYYTTWQPVFQTVFLYIPALTRKISAQYQKQVE